MKETAKNLFFSSESNLTSCDTVVLQLFSVQFYNSPLQDNHVKLHYLQVDLADASKHEYTHNHFLYRLLSLQNTVIQVLKYGCRRKEEKGQLDVHRKCYFVLNTVTVIEKYILVVYR